MNRKGKRKTTVDLYPTTDQILNAHDVNLTKELNNFIQSKYGSIEMLEHKAEELRTEKKEQLEVKQQAERRINEIQDELDRIERLRTRNDVVKKIKKNPEKRKKVERAVQILRKEKRSGDSDTEQLMKFTERQAELLIEDKGLDEFEDETMEETLKLLAEIG